jgi:hypothetical protein
MGVKVMVPFDVFWQRLKSQLSSLPGPAPGVHVRTVRKWSQYSGYLGGEFALLYRGGDTIVCETATTDNVRTGISAAEFRKVYQVWEDYRARRIGRSVIVHDMGVQNAAWIIPILYEYESLMN